MISSSDSSRTSSPAMKRAIEKRPILKTKLSIKKDNKALSSDSLTDNSNSKLNLRKEPSSKSCGITRPESPSIKRKNNEVSILSDSLLDSKKKSISLKNKVDEIKTDTSITDIHLITPKLVPNNKNSPLLSRIITTKNQVSVQEKIKKPVSASQPRSPMSTIRRPARSLESSTAASRSRAAAALSIYHPATPNLRRNLLDAAKTPDIPNKFISSNVMAKTNLRSSPQSVRIANKNDKRDSAKNHLNTGSPSKKSPKKNEVPKFSKSVNVSVTKQKIFTKTDEKSKTKSQTPNGDGPKFLSASSRSGTFLKDEPTILKKSDLMAAEINI